MRFSVEIPMCQSAKESEAQMFGGGQEGLQKGIKRTLAVSRYNFG